MKDADVFIGLSIANIVTPEMLLSMANDPIVFAMANPDPEIKYDIAIKTRKDIIMATGRSDHPNQVNNLDVRATAINEAMKMAAVKALAELTREPVPEQVNIAYGETRMTFGRDYVAKEPITDWEKYKEVLMQRSGTDNKMVRLLHRRAKSNIKRIVYAEADHLDVLKAAQIVHEEGILVPTSLLKKETNTPPNFGKIEDAVVPPYTMRNQKCESATILVL